MDKTYVIRGYNITASYDPQIVHIVNDDQLSGLLAADLDAGTEQLVTSLKHDYFTTTGRELRIADNSLIVEIWGHVYFEYLVSAIDRRFRLGWTARFAGLVSKRCKVIDSGERARDGNRIFWDLIAPGRRLLAKVLKNKLRIS